MVETTYIYNQQKTLKDSQRLHVSDQISKMIYFENYLKASSKENITHIINNINKLIRFKIARFKLICYLYYIISNYNKKFYGPCFGGIL